MFIDMLRWLGILALAFLIVYWWLYGRRNAKGKPLTGGMWRYDRPARRPTAKAQSDDYQRLLSACFGNRDKAERLIDYELARRPGMGRDEGVRRALNRLQYDRS